MFKELQPLLEKLDINITISAKGEQISFSILPKGKDKKDLKVTPLTGTATAEELDKQLPDIISKTLVAEKEALFNLTEFKQSVAKATEAHEKSATTSSSSTAKSTPAAVKEKTFYDSRPPSANKNEIKVWDAIKKTLEEAEKRIARDPDMESFYEKELLKMGSQIKSNKKMPVLVRNAWDEVVERTKAKPIKEVKDEVPKDPAPKKPAVPAKEKADESETEVPEIDEQNTGDEQGADDDAGEEEAEEVAETAGARILEKTPAATPAPVVALKPEEDIF